MRLGIVRATSDVYVGCMTRDPVPYWVQRIQELTMRSGLSQAELARRAGMSRDAFNRYHSGRTRPPGDKLLVLAELFSVDPQDIDPDTVTLKMPTDVRTMEPFRVGRASNGDPNCVHLQLSVDVHISTMSKILELVNEEL